MDSCSLFQQPLLAGLPSAFPHHHLLLWKSSQKGEREGTVEIQQALQSHDDSHCLLLCVLDALSCIPSLTSHWKQISVFPADSLTHSGNYYLQYCVFSHTLPLYWGELQKSFQEVCPCSFWVNIQWGFLIRKDRKPKFRSRHVNFGSQSKQWTLSQRHHQGQILSFCI